MYPIDTVSMWKNKKKIDAKNKSNNNWLYILSTAISAPSLSFTHFLIHTQSNTF